MLNYQRVRQYFNQPLQLCSRAITLFTNTSNTDAPLEGIAVIIPGNVTQPYFNDSWNEYMFSLIGLQHVTTYIYISHEIWWNSVKSPEYPRRISILLRVGSQPSIPRPMYINGRSKNHHVVWRARHGRGLVTTSPLVVCFLLTLIATPKRNFVTLCTCGKQSESKALHF